MLRINVHRESFTVGEPVKGQSELKMESDTLTQKDKFVCLLACLLFIFMVRRKTAANTVMERLCCYVLKYINHKKHSSHQKAIPPVVGAGYYGISFHTFSTSLNN